MDLTRRGLLGMVGGSPGLALFSAAARAAEPGGRPDPGFVAQWGDYTSRFVSDDGRVIDTGNGGMSHSEGQGYGMLFAVAADDRAEFDMIHFWTRHHLQIRPDDRLHAWCYRPGGTPPVPDMNNATDGDLLIALALTRAAVRWSAPAYQDAAAAIFKDVQNLCTLHARGGHRVLLPGSTGFGRPDGLVINLSYYVFPALQAAAALGNAAGDPARWDHLVEYGAGLIGQARFGRWSLPPDWLAVSPDGHLRPAAGWPPRFSFDAVRIPLHLLWGGLFDNAEVQRFSAYWNGFANAALPGWVDLITNAPAPYAASVGTLAIARVTGLAGHPASHAACACVVSAAPDYYAASLTLLAALVRMEV